MAVVYRDHYVSLFDAWRLAGFEIRDGMIVDHRGKGLSVELGVKLLTQHANLLRERRGDFLPGGCHIVQL